MASQIHKQFTNEQVKELLQKYLNKEIERKYLQEILGIGKSRFFKLIQIYRSNPTEFSVEYKRSGKTRSIAPEIKNNIIKELAIDKKAIQNKDIPLYKFNYSYVKKRLEREYNQSAGVSTIIRYDLPQISGQLIKMKRNVFRTQTGLRSQASNEPVCDYNTSQRIQKFLFWPPPES